MTDGAVGELITGTTTQWVRRIAGVAAFATAALILSVSPAQAAAPDAPTGVTVAAADGSLEVTWTAAADGGVAVDRYTATAYSALIGGVAVSNCITNVGDVMTTCFIPGLTNGTTYYVEVVARNADGTGAASAPRVAGKPGAKPSIPRLVLVNRVFSGVAVSWLAPSSDGGSPITGYTALAYDTTSLTADPVATCTTATQTCTISGLVKETTYYVSVHATNAMGSGPDSARVTVRPGFTPEAPRFVTVVRGNGLALASWSPPLLNGGSTITRYVARAFRTIEGGEPMATCEPLTLFKLTCPVGPLPNGSTYYIEVVAYNSLGEGTPSSPRLAIIPATTPSSPRSVTASRVGPEVHVQWGVPEADGGLAISSYVATAYTLPTGGTSVGSCTTDGDRCDIHALTGAPVYIDVIARTPVGDSPASTPRVKVRLVDRADAPTAVAGSPRHRAIAVSWRPPLSNGGLPVTAYRATAYTWPTGGTAVSSCVLPVTAANAAETAPGSKGRVGCSIHGLAQGTIYYIEAGSTTEVGTSASATRTAVRVRPGNALPPRTVKGFPADSRIKVTWELPASDGGVPITAYRVQAWTKPKDGQVTNTCTVPAVSGQSDYTCMLDVEFNFEPYWVEVAAQTSRGWGQSSARVHLEANPAVPAAPERVVLAPRDLGIAVRWEAPSFDGGYPVYGYVAKAYTAATGGSVLGQCSVHVTPKTSATATTPTTCTIGGLKEDQYVYVDVTAENTVGISAPSARESATVIPGRPVAPSGVKAEPGTRGVLVSWTAPAASSSMPIIGYRVRAYVTAGGSAVGECTTKTTSCTITAPGGKLATLVTVAAQNAAGWSDPTIMVGIPQQ